MTATARFLRREPSAAAAYVLLAVIVAAWVATSPNLDLVSVTSTISQKLPLIAVSIAAAIVILGRGIDLSVGGTLTLANVIVAAGTERFGSVGLWVLVALAVCVGVGLVNGYLVAYLGLPSLIATLATQSILLGLALYILPTPGGSVPVWYTNLSLLLVGPLPLSLLLVVLIPLVLWWPLRRSRFGVALLAVGGDQGAAFTSGVPVRRVVASSFVLSGFFAGLGGVLVTANAGSGDPTIGVPYTLNALAAAVLGGCALAGGRGTIVGTVAGALVLSFVNNLLFALDVSTYWQYVATGGLLVAALALPVLLARARTLGGA